MRMVEQTTAPRSMACASCMKTNTISMATIRVGSSICSKRSIVRICVGSTMPPIMSSVVLIPGKAGNMPKPWTAHFHIKDWIAGEKHGCLAGEGQGRIPEVIAEWPKAMTALPA